MDRRFEIEEFPKEFERKLGILGADRFNYGRTQLIEFGD